MCELIFDAVRRADLRAMLAGKGCPADLQHAIVDVACHAAEAAYGTFSTILAAHPDFRVTVTASGIAVSLLQAVLEGHLEGLKQFAAATGLEVGTATLQARGRRQ